nr:MAG TPA_asm: hypothetical protein [Caudoviricetes sp.]DAS94746.1 MAG TPA: hypothetical protein [Caudoviricetes sp.]
MCKLQQQLECKNLTLCFLHPCLRCIFVLSNAPSGDHFIL